MVSGDWPSAEELRTWEHEHVLHRIDELALHRRLRQVIRIRRIEGVARWLGREVGAGRLSATKADQRLEALVRAYDPDTPIELYLVPIDEGRRIAKSAFAAGLEVGHRQLYRKVS